MEVQMSQRGPSGGKFNLGVAMSACVVLIGFFTILSGLILAHPASAGASAPGEALRITRITPSGDDVPPGRQIVFEFDRPVVSLGRMERSPSEIPISIEPAISCQWRWLNSSDLACQLDEQHSMAPATRYKITVKPEIKSEDGARLAEPVAHSFITQRPHVTSVYFEAWVSPGKPQIRVRFDQSVNKDSLESHFFFKTGAKSRVAAAVIEDNRYESTKAGTAWLLSPAVELPEDRAGELVVEPGVTSVGGTEPAVESRSVFSFRTLGQFRFEGVLCQDSNGKELTIRPEGGGQHTPVRSACDPEGSVSLVFTSPVAMSAVKKNVSISLAAGQGGPIQDILPGYEDLSALKTLPEKGHYFSYELTSEFIKPFTKYRVQSKARDFKDAFGRSLARPIDMRFAMDHLRPDLSLYKNMSVLEKGIDTDLPAFATNIDRIDLKYQTYTTAGKASGKSASLPGPRVRDDSVVMPMGIRKLIPAESGVISGTIGTVPASTRKSEEPNWFFAQVTPFDVHVKMGHFNTLVWITDFQTGQPVSGVSIEVRRDSYRDLGTNSEALTKAVTDENGIAELAGTAEIDPKLELAEGYSHDSDQRFLVMCRRGADMAVVPLMYHFRVDCEGANYQYIPSWMRSQHGHMHAWGATAQGIYKVGDTVQYKIYVRDQQNRHFIAPPESSYSLKVVDPTSKVVFQRDNIKLSKFGALDGEFVIPKNGAVGYYDFQLESSFVKVALAPMQVLVSDFTPSPFQVVTELNGKMFGTEESVTVSTQAKLHAGGPYGDAHLGISASVETRAFKSENPFARGFQFDVVEKTDQEDRGETHPEVQTVFQTKGQLDNNGNFESHFKIADMPLYYGLLTVESSVEDERGKSVANRATAIYFGRDRFVGLKPTEWVFEEGKPAKTAFLVTDQTGNAVPDVQIQVEIDKLQTKAARVKGAGDAYLTQYETEWVQDETLTATSGSEPRTFEFIPKQSGTVRIVASVADSKGRIQKTAIRSWVAGKSNVLWKNEEGNLLNIYPEKQTYRVGDTARFFVQNPFPGAKALVTVERYGVLERWVKTLESSAEVIDVPVLPDYLPGFYVCVMVMSPRVEKPLGPGGEDLGKPVFRMGYAQLEVKDQFKEIEVKCKTDREVYKPRETVKLEFEARPKNLPPGEPAPPVEIAVTVLDESVFDLLKQKRGAFDPYDGFYTLEDLDLVNYNLIMQLVGREKLEKKGGSPAAAAGFDLGMRSVLKFVSYWNPSVPVDGEGKARVEFELPDNLTGWRVLAMAVTPEDRMGLGESTFKVNQLTEIRPVLPNQVMDGDSFSAGFSVMNRTAENRNIEVKIKAEGRVAATVPGTAVEAVQKITAEPYKRYTVRLPVQASGAGEIVFTVQAGDAQDHDGLKQTMKVLPRLDRNVAAAYGSFSTGEVSQRIEFPEDTRPDSGLLSVGLSPSILAGLEGPFHYMKVYPFECWEQKISRAVMASAATNLAPYFSSAFSWQNASAQAEAILAEAPEFQAPNGGMAFYQPRDDYVSPFLSAFTAKAFNWLEETGHAPPPPVKAKLNQYLLNLLKRDDTEDNASRSVLSNVRALALSALADRGEISRSDVERLYTRLPEMSLFGRAMLLEAMTKLPDTLEMRKKVIESILSHSDRSSGTIRFTEQLDSALYSILSSPIRDNAAILIAFIADQSAGASQDLGDLPLKLMATIATSRKGQDHWDSTQSNLFAAMAAVRYSKVFETQKPQFGFQALLDQQSIGQGSFGSFSDKPVNLEYRAPASDLGRKAAVTLRKEGEGRLYYDTILSYEPSRMSSESTNAGIEIHREYSVERDGKWVLAQSPLNLKTGDLVRVDLFVSLPAERYFVVVNDPVPGGLEPVNRELATSSEVDAKKGETGFAPESFRNRYGDWEDRCLSRWSFYHKELRHDSARFYSERLSPGHYYLSYTAQVIAPGEFTAQPARAEEMYEPDVYGKSSGAVLKVELSE
jgi:hypothetical protein